MTSDFIMPSERAYFELYKKLKNLAIESSKQKLWQLKSGRRHAVCYAYTVYIICASLFTGVFKVKVCFN